MKTEWQVIVVGAGAAGLYAAAEAARRGRSTLLLEKNNKLGVKILMSGGTRCNITHDASWQAIADVFGKRQGRFLKFPLATLQPHHVIERLHTLGVATKVESTGKIFPQSDRAIDVRDALVAQAEQSGAVICTSSPVTAIERTADGFQVATGRKALLCQSLVVTVGGQSYPGCGTTGDGYRWLRELGHAIAHPRPALTPIRVNESWLRELSGITIPDVGVQVQIENNGGATGDKRSFDRGSFLFTHRGCSGPVVLNVSRTVTDPAHNCAKSLLCDWLPGQNEQQLRDALTGQEQRAVGKYVGNVLATHLPRRLVVALCDQAGVDFDKPLAELSRAQAAAVIQKVKRCALAIDGTLGFAKAEVTAGGVVLNEVDPQTMASRVVPGLFVAGEILDVDGPIGGYNFQAAFSTGFVAGMNA